MRQGKKKVSADILSALTFPFWGPDIPYCGKVTVMVVPFPSSL